ncbi:MAG: transcription-repair coupling factor [Phycisphaerales bacterium]|nr:MAG: transcription-repair coupling factor [Phycisphaerales bacterium]
MPKKHPIRAPHPPSAPWLDRLLASPELASIARAMEAGRRVASTGAVGSSTVFLAGALAVRTKRCVALVLAHTDDADEASVELAGAGVRTLHLPALETLPGETQLSADLFAERAAFVRTIAALNPAEETPCVLLLPIAALMQAVHAPQDLGRVARTVRPGDRLDPGELTRWLAEAGYRRVDAIEEPGEFAIRGGIIDVFPPGAAGDADAEPVRLDFFGDELDKLSAVDLDTMGSDRALESATLIAADTTRLHPGDAGVSALDLLPGGTLAVLAETMEIVEQGRGYYERVTESSGIFGPPAVLKKLQDRAHALAEVNQFSASGAAADERVEFPVETLPQFDRDAGTAIAELIEFASVRRVVVACESEAERDRLTAMLAEIAPEHPRTPALVTAHVHRGFVYGPDSDDPFAVVPASELLHRYQVRRKAARMRGSRAMDTFLDLRPGDYVVHQDHGIAKFIGLTSMTPKKLSSVDMHTRFASGGQKRKAAREEAEEFLTLEFAGNSRLHVPAMQIDLVQKYVGGFSGKPPLSTVGGKKWQHQKERVGESVRDLAAELLRVRAAREHQPGTRYPDDTDWQRSFEGEFPYDETEDQLAALGEIKRDMQAPRPMDRLVCGDVGFGKTELAIRAAFKACEFGKQVAILVPTTVLAEQHERTFRARFAGYPFRVESLSRFKTTRELNQTLAALRKGQVDVVIGTHRLLSKDVRFADLGLVVIDEEQRFGVEHKERLLHLRMTVDVLTLSATPIPRTLHMSMLGLRDISSLTTPPGDRRAIVTEVFPHNPRRIERAIARELSRDGQVYVVHNRVHSIRTVADDIRKLAPDARIVVGHGQMPPKELEEVMLAFMRREADILVATTIIESGIDIPTANTMIITDADRYGLADLHQLRGRVGRSKHRAYCYLLLPPDRPVAEVAQKRLRAIETFSMLGAGFKIAMRDLEIRGAGNILGAEQSGHIAAVGYEMFCRLLDDAVRELKREKPVTPPSRTTVDIGISGVIPKPYIPSETRRLEAYRRLATAANPEELAKFEDDLVRAYGKAPEPVERLIAVSRLRAAAAALGVRAISVRDQDVVLRCDDPKGVVGALTASGGPGTVTALPPKSHDSLHEVYFRPPAKHMEARSLLRTLTHRLAEPANAVLAERSEPVRPAR